MSVIEPLGFKCPKCGHEEVNIEARHVRTADGSTSFRAIVQAVEIRLCEGCRNKERPDGSQRNTDADEEGQAGR